MERPWIFLKKSSPRSTPLSKRKSVRMKNGTSYLLTRNRRSPAISCRSTPTILGKLKNNRLKNGHAKWVCIFFGQMRSSTNQQHIVIITFFIWHRTCNMFSCKRPATITGWFEKTSPFFYPKTRFSEEIQRMFWQLLWLPLRSLKRGCSSMVERQPSKR